MDHQDEPVRAPAKQEELELSGQRTELAAERTLMSWIRTALSMIGYGFGLFKVLQYMLKAEEGAPIHHPASDALATGLVALGTGLLIAASVQYHRATRELRKQHGVGKRVPLPLLGATGVAFIGLIALANLILTVSG